MLIVLSENGQTCESIFPHGLKSHSFCHLYDTVEAVAFQNLAFAALRLPGYFPLLVSTGCVTIEIFVIPACFTASITLANAPKGTRSSARR
jgi:hypothetical protein